MAYRTVCLAIVLGQIHDGVMWVLGDGEAVSFWLICFFLFVGWKVMLSHGAFVVLDLVMHTAYDRNRYCDCC